MAASTPFEEMQDMVDALRIADTNSQLLLAKMRDVTLKAKRLETSLALLVGLLASRPDPEGGFIVNQISHQLELCINAPEFAAQVVGCDPEHIDPAILRAAIGALAGGEQRPSTPTAEQGVVLH